LNLGYPSVAVEVEAEEDFDVVVVVASKQAFAWDLKTC